MAEIEIFASRIVSLKEKKRYTQKIQHEHKYKENQKQIESRATFIWIFRAQFEESEFFYLGSLILFQAVYITKHIGR